MCGPRGPALESLVLRPRVTMRQSDLPPPGTQRAQRGSKQHVISREQAGSNFRGTSNCIGFVVSTTTEGIVMAYLEGVCSPYVLRGMAVS